MLKSMKKTFAYIAAGLFSISTAAAQSVYWEVKSPEGKLSHLLGTYHLLGSDYISAHPAMEADYQKASTVVVEVIIDSTQLPKVAQAGMMPNGSLKSMTDSLDYALLSSIFEPLLGFPLQFADQLLPIGLSLAYSMDLAQKNMPASLRFDGQPIDMFLGKDAKRLGKEVLALESLEEQMKILYSSQTAEEQLTDLISLVKDTAEARMETRTLIEAYAKGDLQKMMLISEETEVSMGDMKVWLDNRNVKWIPQLLPLLNEGNAFIAVGALHLPGEKGLLELLKAEGYTLSPVK